jgi:hypothetical protein
MDGGHNRQHKLIRKQIVEAWVPVYGFRVSGIPKVAKRTTQESTDE